MAEFTEIMDLQRCVEAFGNELASPINPLTFKSFQGALLLSYAFTCSANFIPACTPSQGECSLPWAVVMLFYSCVETSTMYLNRVHSFFIQYFRDTRAFYELDIKHDPSIYLQFTNIYRGARESKYLTELHRYIEAIQEDEAWNDLLFQISYTPSTSIPCCYFVFALGCLWESIAVNVHTILPFSNMKVIDLRVHGERDLLLAKSMLQTPPGGLQEDFAYGQEEPYNPLLQACPLLFLKEGDVKTPRIIQLLTVVLKMINQFAPALSLHRRINRCIFRLSSLKKFLHDSYELCISDTFRRKMEVKFGLCINAVESRNQKRSKSNRHNATTHKWIGSALKTDIYKNHLEYLPELERFITDDSCGPASVPSNLSYSEET
ncbi:hypothetical protein GL50803_003421 [Giardia duodenalis]|uniref:Uncharacterized protein n=1 Tax=Giardia intestinalis (strain ATCC 50803 / WB clone C6) TaxID=184922 RepID=A8BJM7_GIAIC|nr:hypothetical protein GL50803_003421 [Giardia intestinalis]KAE8303921.1 hypothetical protein GL50803_003421 [Giardia intestinalis]|eukprot:XP_001706616.1 Hypothetical protein GL50803_3421 [Giardia lamblia ATCC 50803]